MTKGKGFLVMVGLLAAVGIMGQLGAEKAARESEARDAARVEALSPAERASMAAASAKAAYRASLRNAKVDEAGILRPNFYICPSGPSLSRANELFRTDPEAASKYAGDRGCEITQSGRDVLVDELVAFGVRRVHYRGDPAMWYVESDGVAATTSGDIDSLRRAR